MQYRIVHRTTYRYDSPVTVGHYKARLAPRTLPGQKCPWYELTVRPRPHHCTTHPDYFGNHVTYFEIEGAHAELEVTASSLVRVLPVPHVDPLSTPPWERILEACLAPTYTRASAAQEFCFASALIQPAPIFADYARPSFVAGRPVLDAVLDLNRRIHQDFAFDPSATDIATPIVEVMQRKRGVCQDFAQVMIACLRSVGLPARYVSGYLETLPPPGKPRLVGADASHAWVSVYCGEKCGWMDVDPTNNMQPAEHHITVGWGRDFSDVSPLRGVTLGAGDQHLTVSVDVLAIGDQ